MKKIINKTMDREDFLLPGGLQLIHDIDALIKHFKDLGLALSGWNGKLTTEKVNPNKDARNCGARGQYFPLPGAADDPHFPWFLYWEIFWALRNTPLKEGSWILDAGGSCSLFWAIISEMEKYRIFSCDINKKLIEQALRICIKKNWTVINLRGEINQKKTSWSIPVLQDVTELHVFPDKTFDAVFSICVMEHLTRSQRQKAMREFYRVLEPGGRLTLTFDYKNPLPAIYKPDPTFNPDEHLLSTPEQLRSSFLSDEDLFELVGNQDFYDNGKLYLGHPKLKYAPYTFGALFLRRR